MSAKNTNYSSHREWLIIELEAEVGNVIDFDGYTTRELEDMFDQLIGSMNTGILIQ